MKILWGLLLCLALTSCVENSKKKESTQETENRLEQVIYLDANTPIEHDTLYPKREQDFTTAIGDIHFSALQKDAATCVASLIHCGQ